MSIRFDGRVAIVTGAGNGLGRAHALGFAARGAKVVANDLGVARDGTGESSSAAEAVVKAIRDAGGEAIADGANVAEFAQVQAMVDKARSQWGRVDILINNAGILRDKTFVKMEPADFRTVIDVHLMGAFNCCKAVWETMRQQNYGRIVMVTSATGLYGNFGQSNYGSAKAAVVGLMNTLHHEGAKYNIRVNALAPVAATRMTEGLMMKGSEDLLKPEAVTPGVLFLAGEEAPSKTILCAGAGVFAATRIRETAGVYLPESERTPEGIAAHFGKICDASDEAEIDSAWKQNEKFVRIAAKHEGIELATA
jgi:NAD(P)-dependent dehydrogenase (short-subunit alcohol dehydrogenase family)